MYPWRPVVLPNPVVPEPVIGELEVDDPMRLLKVFIAAVEESLGEGGVREGFAELKSILLEAMGTPTTAINAM